MKNAITVFATLGCLVSGSAAAQSFESDVEPLIYSACIDCHDAATKTPLNFDGLGHDLSDTETFAAWVNVFDRVKNGEMPPDTEPRPDRAEMGSALGWLKGALVEANQARRGGQRVPLRRLTRLEYGYTIADLLKIDEAISAELIQSLPAEADSGGFDTVAANQTVSPLHVRSYLRAADRALDAALVLGPQPKTGLFHRNYVDSQTLPYLVNTKGLGLGILKKLDDAYAAFFDFGSTYSLHSVSEGFAVPRPGRYRVALEAYAYQADTPVVLTLYQGKFQGVTASLDTLIGTLDLIGKEARTIEATPFLRPGDLVGPSLAELDGNPQSALRSSNPNDGYDMTDYKGEGIAMKSLTIEGPLIDMWPPQSTRHLLKGVEFDEQGGIELTKSPYEHIAEIVGDFAPRAFRRPLEEGELEAYASLAEPVLADGRPFIEAVRVPLRAILSTPAFLYQAGESQELDDFALASRLSYFLWRSMPDDELFEAAAAARLSDPAALAQQVDRMLDDPKSQRFIKDFAGQAYRLYDLKVNTPDPGLYPEYDDRLGQAMAAETEMFLTELIAENYGVDNLIDSDFTYVNRRLAEHYGIEGIEGQEMRRVAIPADSPRGGLLTQASIHKVTSNGTNTSPIPRGNFVLSNLMGTPAAPPPPGAGTIEPDTRGTNTIRELLEKHRESATCARCHRVIDPPGFALESFDPIGGFRTRYRVAGGTITIAGFTVPNPTRQGLPVDPSGVTLGGNAFDGIEAYKRILIDEQLDQVARNMAAKLLVFSTGAEIEFADREAIEKVLDTTRDGGFGVRDIIQQVVHNELFRKR